MDVSLGVSRIKSTSSVLRFVFVAFFAQMAVLLVGSTFAQKGPLFVNRFFLGYDYVIFFRAAQAWLAHQNPYSARAFITPASSMLASLPLVKLTFHAAALIFAFFNLAVIFSALAAYMKSLRMQRGQIELMFGITLLYYPFYYILDRGNLDGLILGCILFAAVSRLRVVRAALAAIAVGLKLYPILLFIPLFRKRRFKTIILAAVFLLLLQLPFLGLERSFLHAVLDRGGRMWVTNNISPAVLLYVAATGLHVHVTALWKAVFFLGWLATLVIAISRGRLDSNHGPMLDLVAWIPWMVSFPLLVYPYVGVLLLPLAAWRFHRLEDGYLTLPDKLFLVGFLLTGFQPIAFAALMSVPGIWDRPFHLVNAFGVLLILIGSTFTMRGGAERYRRRARNVSEKESNFVLH